MVTYPRLVFEGSKVIAEMEFRKLRRDPIEFLVRLSQPLVWLFFFGVASNRIYAPVEGSISYMTFIVPGIVAYSVVNLSVFTGFSLIREKELGLIHKFIVTPTPTVAYLLGKVIFISFRALLQFFILVVLAFLLDTQLHINFNTLFVGGIIVLISSTLFTCFAIIVASFIRSVERFIGLGQFITLPLFFTSTALFPIDKMPEWLKLITLLNPLSYSAEGFRDIFIYGCIDCLLFHLLILLMFTIVIVILSILRFPKIVLR